jgi:predicted TIM-barrel fold metal-dependent hydrolase
MGRCLSEIDMTPEQVGAMFWGSDWPHTNVEGHMPDDGELLTLLREWVPDVTALRRILVDNPATLYGFGG